LRKQLHNKEEEEIIVKKVKINSKQWKSIITKADQTEFKLFS
jgi:hypothetical protein